MNARTLQALTRAALVVALAAAPPAWAREAAYTPVRCDGARPYEGAALKPAPAEAAFDAAGSLEGEFDAAVIARLEDALAKAMKATRAPAMTVAVSQPGRGTWSAERATGAMPERFAWASVGKMVTAVVIMQLAEETRLSLDDPIARYVPDVPHGEFITLAHLLEHTSGLFSANEDRRVRTRASNRPMPISEHLAIARRHGAMFCPGQNWRYSNTGYALLGEVIEKIEGAPYADVAERRVLARIGPGTLRMLQAGDAAADVAPAAPSVQGEHAVALGSLGPAGGIVGRARDMNRLLQAVITSQLVSRESTRRQFARLYPMFGADTGTAYGHGVMLTEPAGAGIYWLGHGGGSPGIKSVTAWSPRHRAFVSVALTGDGSAPATANLLLKALAADEMPAK